LFITNIKSHINKRFKNPKLRSVLQFPVLFLGAKPSQTPAFYNFMNFADFGLGTWQPKNGFFDVILSMIATAKNFGVKFYNNSPVQEILVKNKSVCGIKTKNKIVKCDIIVSGADYSHTEKLLPKILRQYSNKYWSNRTWSPSSLLFYLGLNTKINDLDHHNLFFDTDFDNHADEIYSNPKWPKSPLFYLNITSKTFNHTAPKGCENLFILIPIATDLDDNEKTREKYFDLVIKRIESKINQKIKNNIIYKRSYCIKEFKDDYNSFGGNAYGLANTLTQTAFLRPKLESKKVKKLYFSGQLTVPGPGVPPSIVSGKLVSDLIIKDEVNI
jgi:phytoene desaturase